jgi:recombinational DNA repair ATPase RecF
MVSDRLVNIENKLELLYEQLDSLENDALTNQNPRARTQSKQQIREEIQPQIREYEAKYLRVLHQESATLTFNEADAQAVIDVVAQEVATVERQVDTYPDEYRDRVIQLLQEIKTKVEAPEPTAAAKLKGVLSPIPPFIGISYEAEIDTENFLRKYFPTFTRLVKSAKK